jgi:chlorobactene glucosyltransferase
MPKQRSSPPAWLVGGTLLALGGSVYLTRLLGQSTTPPLRRRAVAGAGMPASPLPPGCTAWPRVSIIVPSRNEERNLPALIPSLLAQAYPPDRYEIVVVDDQSTDATPAILAEFAADHPQLRVVGGEPLPEGWKGKCWAMAQGAAVAQGDWLLFTDADTVYEPENLASTVYDAVERQADLYTIAPELIMGGPAERLIMPIVAMGITVFYNPRYVNDPNNPVAIANGQYLLVRRSVYDAVGGVAAVRNEIAEDLEFGRLVKRNGYRLYLTEGRGLMRVRMYQNFAEVWEGWRKNVLLAMKKQPIMGVLQLGATGLGFVPFVLLAGYGGRVLRAGRQAAPGDQMAAGLAAVQLAAIFANKRAVDRHLGLPWGWTFSFPVGLAVFVLILLDSLRRLVTGQGVTWKGRSYTE